VVKEKYKNALEGVDLMHNTLKFGHYDLKPGNIGGTDGKLFDFGECVPTGGGEGKNPCGHPHTTEEYIPIKYIGKPETRNKTADLFALGVTLFEMMCGKIENKPGRDGKHGYCWKLDDGEDRGDDADITKYGSKDDWKARWAVVTLKDGLGVPGTEENITCSLPTGDQCEVPCEAPCHCERRSVMPACLKAKALVHALLVDFETIEWSRITTLHDAFQECLCSNYCNKPAKTDSRRRLIERFIRASEYCISS